MTPRPVGGEWWCECFPEAEAMADWLRERGETAAAGMIDNLLQKLAAMRGGTIATVRLNVSVNTADANAHLIAAAPDLYEALRLMLSHGERCNWFADSGDDEVCAKATAALAKARGEPHE